jgi:OOP family OmpA-OmpF porin
MRGYGRAAALGAAALITTGWWTSASGATAPGPADGPYLRLEGGLSIPPDINGTITSSSPSLSTTSIELSPHAGPIGGAALGLRLAPLRIELDGDWMRSTLKSSAASLTGKLENIPVMANGFIDFDNETRVAPYIGLGVGMSIVSLETTATGGGALVNSTTHVFAFQPIIGVNIKLTDRLTAGLQYRYFKTADPGFRAQGGQKLSINNSSNIVLATLTFHFFAPAKATPAAIVDATPPLPLPGAPVISHATPRLFLVYFDFDSAQLNGPGRHAADAAIASYRADPTTDIAVSGFTDAVGTEAYNLELSKRRAMSVYEYFAEQGVKPSDMDVGWHGKANPRVPSDGREPQNRRVEIQM